jgi:hypothetical protein
MKHSPVVRLSPASDSSKFCLEQDHRISQVEFHGRCIVTDFKSLSFLTGSSPVSLAQYQRICKEFVALFRAGFCRIVFVRRNKGLGEV